MTGHSTAVIVGVGAGQGLALMRKLIRAGMRVAIVEKDSALLEPYRPADFAGRLRCYVCDTTDAPAVAALFDAVRLELGTPELVVFSGNAHRPAGLLETSPHELERCWRNSCLAAFTVAQEAARDMTTQGHGTIILTGATSEYGDEVSRVALAVARSHLRALTLALAEELGPKGVHVAYVAIEQAAAHAACHGSPEWGEADDIVDKYLFLFQQPRPSWTHELDVTAEKS